MQEKIEALLNTSEKRQALIDTLDQSLKETNFYQTILNKAEQLIKERNGDYKELTGPLTDFIFNNMPDEAKKTFTKEIVAFIDSEISLKL